MTADFYRDSKGWVHLDKLDDGRLMCCICFEWCKPTDEDLSRNEDGDLQDVCHACWRTERSHGKFVWAFRT